jgi:diguanylate cyclase (GGDEF)-like protein
MRVNLDKNWTMDPLLRHMVDMTGHRDHAMLDLSVLSAVQELAHAAQTRVLTIVPVRDQIFIRPRAIMTVEKPARLEDGLDSNQPGEAIAQFPELKACLDSHEECAIHLGQDRTLTLWLPIWLKEKAHTCLEIVNPTPYNEQTQQVIAGIVGVYRNYQNLLDYSERDSLTGLLNRKTFDDRLAKMLSASTSGDDVALPETQERRCADEVQKQWLAVIDVDHFKKVNDRFGHLYGDEVLILIANLMQSSFRSQDRIFRFGGEEFVVLLRSSTLDQARKIIERFRLNVENYPFPQVERITVSVGFVDISAFESPVVILGHADQALYYAKSHGRNMTCHYAELLDDGNLQTTETNATVEFF